MRQGVPSGFCRSISHGPGSAVKLPDGSVRKINTPPFDTPFTFMLGELFKIKNMKITRGEAVLLSVPYGMPSGWSAAR